MIKAAIKKLIRLIPLKFVETYLIAKFKYNNLSYSQYGEDVILKHLLINKKKGVFVDVGAHHPTIFSNTYALYREGWKGVNIDCAPGVMAAFKKERPLDINLEIGISAKNETLDFYIFSKSALNTFSREKAHNLENQGYKIQNKVKIQTMPLRTILDNNLAPGCHIDFMNVDVEGLDLRVLQSNDWSKYKPDVIAIEGDNFAVENLSQSEIYIFLYNLGYKLKAFSLKTLFFEITK